MAREERMISDIPARAAVLGVARAMTWVREIGENRGQAVEAILASVHLPPGSPWCAAFVSYCGRAALGGFWPLPMAGGCATLAEAADAKGLLRPTPAPGAIFLLYSSDLERFHHTGFIVLPAPLPGHYATVEGNTNDGGSPEGVGVFQRERQFTSEDRFVWWWL
jgi:hypothetical protein